MTNQEIVEIMKVKVEEIVRNKSMMIHICTTVLIP